MYWNNICKADDPGTAAEVSPFRLPEVRISITYLVLGSLWIVLSDLALDEPLRGWGGTVGLQTFKGLNFVVTTGILLFLVLRRAFGGWRRAEEDRLENMRAARECYRKLSSKLQAMREEERTRFSREIHDELGQLLTGIKMQVRMTEDKLADRDDRSLNPMIDALVETSSMIDETMVAVRRIAAGLRPSALDNLGLEVALSEEAHLFTKRTGIECNLKVGEMRESIRPEVETTAFRIFQESLTNVIRHAEAARIDAECSCKGNDLLLTVRDDGVGIEPDDVATDGSLGIIGMKERAADAGGKVEIEGGPDGGTAVRLTIPLEA